MGNNARRYITGRFGDAICPLLDPTCLLRAAARAGAGNAWAARTRGCSTGMGRPLIAWLHELVRPLTDDLIISCNRNSEQYAHFADRLVADDQADFQGPWRASEPACAQPCIRTC